MTTEKIKNKVWENEGVVYDTFNVDNYLTAIER